MRGTGQFQAEWRRGWAAAKASQPTSLINVHAWTDKQHQRNFRIWKKEQAGSNVSASNYTLESMRRSFRILNKEVV